MSLGQENQLQVSRKLDMRLILSSAVLQLTSAELNQMIENELSDNPALESKEPEPEQSSLYSYEVASFSKSAVADEDVSQFDASSSQNFDPLANLRATISFQEHLCSQMRSFAPDDLQQLCEYLIYSLDTNGFLTEPLEMIASERNEPIEKVEAALKVVQSLEPSGVGARDLRECLLIQLAEMENGVKATDRDLLKTARLVVSDYLDQIGKKCYTRIGRKLKCNAEHIQQVAEFITKNLNPNPASGFDLDFNGVSTLETPVHIYPDVAIIRSETGFTVQPLVGLPSKYCVNDSWIKEYRLLRNSAQGVSHQAVVEYVNRARLFLKFLEMRVRTIQRVVQCIVKHQIGYIETGSVQFLRPLTRSAIAAELGIHESTVSRALIGKYVLMPNQDVVPFDLFFDNSLRVRVAIQNIVAREDSTKPLSDQRIVNILSEQGIKIARRTVSKYREQQNIVASLSRRK